MRRAVSSLITKLTDVAETNTEVIQEHRNSDKNVVSD